MRTIFHCDINNCFASIEMAREPNLRGKAIAVCGDPQSRRGIVLAKSEAAKRCGVATGDPLWMACQKCPSIVFVPPHFELYEAYSRELRRYYGRYPPLVEPFGLDECWLDLTDNVRHGTSAEELAETIRTDIKRIFDITVSIGVSFNKVFAKLGSDMKKPDAVTYIPYESFREKIWHLPVSDLLDVGRATARRLRDVGIVRIGQLAQARREGIAKLLGKNGARLWMWANGYDDSPVLSETHTRVRQSLGHGTTLPADATCLAQLRPWIMSLAERIAIGLQGESLAGHGIQVYVRDALLRFETYQYRDDSRYEASESIAKAALGIIAQRYSWDLPVHGVGIRIYDLFDTRAPYQNVLFKHFDAERNARVCRIDSVVASVQEKYGATALSRGFNLAMPAIQPSTFPKPR